MKKILRIGFIGTLHMTVYLWLLPFVILPKFGNVGTKITVTILILISLIVLSSLIIKKRKKNPRLKNQRCGKSDCSWTYFPCYANLA